MMWRGLLSMLDDLGKMPMPHGQVEIAVAGGGMRLRLLSTFLPEGCEHRQSGLRHPRVVIFAIVLLVAAAGRAQVRSGGSQKSAQKPAAAPFMQKLRFFEENQQAAKAVLKNGLTVLVNEFRAAPVVVISAYVRSGYAEEPDNLAGISHVLELMFPRGTTSRAPGVTAKDIQTLGANFQSSTEASYVVFDMIVPSMQWKKALDIEADALQNPLFDPEELKRVIGQATGEIRGSEEDFSDEALQKRLLTLGAVSRGAVAPRLGRPETLSALTREKLLEYHRTAFAPARLLIVISGDVTSSEALNEAVKVFDKERPPGQAASAPATMPAQNAMRYQEVRTRSPFSEVLFGFPAPSLTSPDYPAFQFLTNLLGVGDAAACTGRLRDRKKVVNRARADYGALSSYGFLSLLLETASKDIDRVEIAAVTEMELLKREKPDEEAMERAEAQLEERYWVKMETALGRAHSLAQYEMLGDWKKVNDYLPRLRQVKPEDVLRAAKKYLDLGKCSLLECLPADAESRNLSAESIFTLLSGLVGSSADQEAAEREKETIPAVDMPSPPTAFKPSEVRSTFQQASILRGPELYIREEHVSPLIHIGFFFPGGVSFEKKENNGITALMLHSMLGGTQKRTPEQVQRQLALYGADLRLVVERDFYGIFLTMLSRNVEGALDVLLDVVQSPKFDKDVVTRKKELLLADLQRESSDSMAKAESRLYRSLFGDHSYALDPEGAPASLAALDANAIKEWHKNNVFHRKPVVIIIGDTQGTSLAGYFVKNFSGSRFSDIKPPEDFPKPMEKKVTVEGQGGGSRSLVALGFMAPPFGDEDSYPVTVLQEIFDGIGGRLGEQIRERLNLAGRISMRYRPELRAGVVEVLAETEPAAEESVIKAVADEFSKFVGNPLMYRDYRSALNASTGKYAISQQDRFSRIDLMVRAILTGRSLEWIQDYVSRLQDVKQDDLPDIARRVLSAEKMAVVRIHGQSGP